MNAVQKTILEPTIVVVVKPSGRVDDWVLEEVELYSLELDVHGIGLCTSYLRRCLYTYGVTWKLRIDVSLTEDSMCVREGHKCLWWLQLCLSGPISRTQLQDTWLAPCLQDTQQKTPLSGVLLADRHSNTPSKRAQH